MVRIRDIVGQILNNVEKTPDKIIIYKHWTTKDTILATYFFKKLYLPRNQHTQIFNLDPLNPRHLI
jgi:hypothetical protein